MDTHLVCVCGGVNECELSVCVCTLKKPHKATARRRRLGEEGARCGPRLQEGMRIGNRRCKVESNYTRRLALALCAILMERALLQVPLPMRASAAVHRNLFRYLISLSLFISVLLMPPVLSLVLSSEIFNFRRMVDK